METTIVKTIATWLELDITAVLAIFVALWAYKWVKDKSSERKLRKTETLDNLRTYLDKPEVEQTNFVRELLFEDHFGRCLSWDEISYFLGRDQSLRMLKMYLSSNHYLAIKDASLVMKASGLKWVNRKRWLFFIMYLVAGALAYLMLVGAYSVFTVSGPSLYAIWGAVTLSLVVLAGLFLHSSSAAGTAVNLYKEINV